MSRDDGASVVFLAITAGYSQRFAGGRRLVPFPSIQKLSV